MLNFLYIKVCSSKLKILYLFSLKNIKFLKCITFKCFLKNLIYFTLILLMYNFFIISLS